MKKLILKNLDLRPLYTEVAKRVSFATEVAKWVSFAKKEI